jgi:hypothetical protein
MAASHVFSDPCLHCQAVFRCPTPPTELSFYLTRLTGHFIPLLGFGVYQNYTTKDSVLEALAAGYRCVPSTY